MQSLSNKKWRAQQIKRLFNKFVPGKGKGLNHLKITRKGVNYIGATNRGNGVLCVVEDNNTTHKLIQPGNCIGFIKNGDGSAGYAMYKEELFISTSDVIYGYADWLNRDTGLFFVATQDKIQEKYGHGYKRNLQHLHGDRVMLPFEDSGEPDYKFMAQYASRLREDMLIRYKKYIIGQLSQLKYKELPALNEKRWNRFRAFGKHGLFKIASTSSSIDGIRIIDSNIKNIPYVTRTDANNGISRFVSDKNLLFGSDDANCITIGLDTQTAFWQSHLFVTGQNIQIITGSQLNLWSAQFLIPLFKNQMKAKFNWGGNGATLSRMKRIELMLPVNDTGTPDYVYMEQYVKNMMLRKYQQYLEFLDRRDD
ncbi:restriction endonuclease subunit S [Mobiluncus curtisii]|uniref:Type I restriction modification DNA specificity domain-containing protein n=2 Tax=Mobiluncus curtisii TaxID=2051 RepID=D6ZG52_MOBCV|nr:restriction endonuclease subunit S [Mobiluncus curtisii]ADI67610.1 hypothetical protein HMPREF0573_11291 [Mobiluncus curtisii ATCC 43063]SQB65035.1 Restriction enzyme BgcI subunit beta [Mobiluncus curtisii]